MKKNTLILSVVLLFSAISCKKPDATTSTTSSFSTYSSMDTIYKMLEVKPKYVTVNGITGATFYGTSGTRYTIPPNCLQDGAGNTVTTNVQFEVAEYLEKGDMLFSKMLPISNGELLLSGGELSIKATLSGQPIYLKPDGCKFTATIPKDKDTVSGMQFFVGRELQNNTDNIVNWEKQDSLSSGAIIYNGDTIVIVSDSFQKCNADKFLSTPDYQNILVAVSVPQNISFDSTKFRAMALYDNYKGIWPLGDRMWGEYKHKLYKEFHIPNTPVHFVIYGLTNNRFYAGVTAATPKTGETYTVTLFETDPSQFKAQLNNLTK